MPPKTKKKSSNIPVNRPRRTSTRVKKINVLNIIEDSSIILIDDDSLETPTENNRISVPVPNNKVGKNSGISITEDSIEPMNRNNEETVPIFLLEATNDIRTQNQLTKNKKNIEQATLSKRSAKNTRKKKKSPPRLRPVTISLDVTYSSPDSDWEASDNEQSPPKKTKLAEGVSKSEMPSSGIRYSSSESEGEEVPSKKCNIKNSNDNVFSDEESDEEDFGLYSIDHNADRLQAAQNIEKEKKLIQLQFDKNKLKEEETVKLLRTVKKTNEISEIKKKSRPDSPAMEEVDEIDCDSSKENFADIDWSNVVLKKNQVSKQSRKTQTALRKLEAFSLRVQHQSETGENNDDSILDVSEDDEFESMLYLRIRWDGEFMRLPVKKNKPFAEIYQQFAQKYDVSISEIVFCFNDEIISPNVTPESLKLNIADTIVGGILKNSEKDKESMITLKVQTSNRKETTTVSISLYDKMLLLMKKYADIKKKRLDQLKFRFDGENLSPDESPFDLELEGGECIDVFEL